MLASSSVAMLVVIGPELAKPTAAKNDASKQAQPTLKPIILTVVVYGSKTMPQAAILSFPISMVTPSRTGCMISEAIFLARPSIDYDEMS